MLFGFTSVERELENYISKIDVSINNENNIVNELIDKHDFYYFEHGNGEFFVADTSLDDDYISIRYVLNPSECYYVGYDMLDVTKNIFEVQFADEFRKEFYYVSDLTVNKIKSKVTFEISSEIKDRLISEFNYENYYIRLDSVEDKNMVKRSPILTEADSTKFNTDGALDNYIKTSKNKAAISRVSINGTYQETSDDPIVTLLWKNTFMSKGTNDWFGIEWGFYKRTYQYETNKLMTDVFIYDLDVMYPGDEQNEIVSLVPVVNKSFIYNQETNLVTYWGENTLCITCPNYTSLISYVDNYTEEVDCDGEYIYTLNGPHLYNNGEDGYDAGKDYGFIFESYGAYLEGVCQNSVLFLDTEKKVFSAFYNILTDLINPFETPIISNLYTWATTAIYNLISDEIFKNKVISPSKVDCRKNNNGCYVYEDGLISGASGFNSDLAKTNKGYNYNLSSDKTEENLYFKNSNHLISFNSKLESSRNEKNKDYQAMIDHKLTFKIVEDLSLQSGIKEVKNVSKEFQYLYAPYLTSNCELNLDSITPFSTFMTNFNKNGDKSNYNLECKTSGNYLFEFSNYPSNTRIDFDGKEIFYADRTKITYPNSATIAKVDYYAPKNVTFSKEINLQAGNKYFMKVYSQNVGGDYFFGNIKVRIYLMDSYLNVNSLENDGYDLYHKNIKNASRYKTIRLNILGNSLCTFNLKSNESLSGAITCEDGTILFDGMYQSGYTFSLPVGSSQYLYLSVKSTADIDISLSKNKHLPMEVYSGYRYKTSSLSYSGMALIYYCKSDQTITFKPHGIVISYHWIEIRDMDGTLLKKGDNGKSLSYSFVENKYYIISLSCSSYDKNVYENITLEVS